MSEVEEHTGEPVVDVIQSALFVWSLKDGLKKHNKSILKHAKLSTTNTPYKNYVSFPFTHFIPNLNINHFDSIRV